MEQSNTKKLDYLLGKECNLFTSQQRALEVCLEALGVNVYNTCIVLPVIAPTWVISAVLRSGGTPILLDIQPNNLEYNYQDLKDIVTDQEELVILHCDNYVSNMVLDITREKVNIFITPNYFELNNNNKNNIDKFHFSIHGTENVLMPKGGILYSRYRDTKSTILKIKEGILGVGDFYPEELVHKFIGNYEFSLKWYKEQFQELYRQFDDFLCSKNIKFYLSHDVNWLPLIVDNARKTLVTYHDRGIECKLDYEPLYTFPEIGARYQEQPQYLGANTLYNKVLSIRIMEENLNKLKELIK